MQTLVFHLGVITAVDAINKTLDLVDVTYTGITYDDIVEHQIIPQKGYYVLFFVLYAVAGRQETIKLVKYYSSAYNGNALTDLKQQYLGTKSEGDQLFINSGGSVLALQKQAAALLAGTQQIVLNNAKSSLTIEGDTVTIASSDGFSIKQTQGSDTLTIAKLDKVTQQTTATIDVTDNNITINTQHASIVITNDAITLKSDAQINLQGNTVLAVNEAQADALVKKAGFLSHTHMTSQGMSGTPVVTEPAYTTKVKAE
jgi:hypothetical protein